MIDSNLINARSLVRRYWWKKTLKTNKRTFIRHLRVRVSCDTFLLKLKKEKCIFWTFRVKKSLAGIKVKFFIKKVVQ